MQPFNPSGYPRYRAAVSKFIKPVREWLAPLVIPENPDVIRGMNVTYALRSWKSKISSVEYPPVITSMQA